MLDMKRLRLLREFAIRGSIAEVADVLSYSPSAVSQQLSLLEKEAQVKLFRKVGRGLELTPKGELLSLGAEELLNLLEETETSLRSNLNRVAGTIRIAAFQSAMISLIPAALKILAAKHPDLRVEVFQHEPETALYETWARRFDLVIAEQYAGHSAPHHKGLDRQILGSDEIMLAVPADGSLGEISSISEARDAPWVMEPVGSASRHFSEHACRQSGFNPDVRFETADIQTHLRFVESGNAVALVNGLAALEASKDVRFINFQAANFKRTIFTSSRLAKEDNMAVKALNLALTEAAKQLPVTTPESEKIK